MRDLTPRELNLINALADVWSDFLELPEIHPDHNPEFRHGIHMLQRIIMCRPVGEKLRSENV